MAERPSDSGGSTDDSQSQNRQQLREARRRQQVEEEQEEEASVDITAERRERTVTGREPRATGDTSPSESETARQQRRQQALQEREPQVSEPDLSASEQRPQQGIQGRQSQAAGPMLSQRQQRRQEAVMSRTPFASDQAVTGTGGPSGQPPARDQARGRPVDRQAPPPEGPDEVIGEASGPNAEQIAGLEREFDVNLGDDSVTEFGTLTGRGRQKLAAAQFDQRFPEDDIEVSDVRLQEDGRGFELTPQAIRELEIAEADRNTVASLDVSDFVGGQSELELTEDAQRRVAAANLDARSEIDITGGDLIPTGDGFRLSDEAAAETVPLFNPSADTVQGLRDPTAARRATSIGLGAEPETVSAPFGGSVGAEAGVESVEDQAAVDQTAATAFEPVVDTLSDRAITRFEQDITGEGPSGTPGRTPLGSVLARQLVQGTIEGAGGEAPRDIGETDEVFGVPTQIPEEINLALGAPEQQDTEELTVNVPDRGPLGLPLAGAELEEVGAAQQRGAFEFGQQAGEVAADVAIEGPPGPVPGLVAPLGQLPGGRQAVERAGTGAVSAVAGLPGAALTVTEETGEVGQAAARGETGAPDVTRQLGRSVGQAGVFAVENPALAVGSIGAGVATGGAAGSVIRRAPGAARAARIRSRGGTVFDLEDVSDPPTRTMGELPGFTRPARADPEVARREFLEQARQTDIGGDEPVAFSGRSPEAVQEFGGFGRRFEAPEGRSELSGQFFSADLSNLRLVGGGRSGGVTLGIPRPRIRTSRIMAERDVDVGITRGQSRPEVQQFLRGQADRGQSFIRTDVRGRPTGEQEVIAPPGAQFTQSGGLFGVRVGGEVIPGRLFRRVGDSEADVGEVDDVVSRGDLASETTDAIRSSIRRQQQPDPVTPIFSAPNVGRPDTTVSQGESQAASSPGTPSVPPTSVPPIFGPTSVPPTSAPPETPPTSVPPSGPPSSAPPSVPPSSRPPTLPPSSVPPSVPPSSVPPSGPPVSGPPTSPPSSAPPSRPPPSNPPFGAPSSGGPLAGIPGSPFGTEPLPEGEDDRGDRDDEFLFPLVPTGTEFQNPVASGAEFLFGPGFNIGGES